MSIKEDIKKSLVDYDRVKKEFEKNFIDKNEIELLNSLNEKRSVLKSLLSSDSVNELIKLREEMNRFLETLSSYVYTHSERADWVYIWRKNKMANEWTPLKEKFKKTAADTEKVLEDRYSAERIYSMLEQKRTDYLHNMITVIQNDLRTIQLKIEDIARERINIGREEKQYRHNTIPANITTNATTKTPKNIY